MKMTCAHNIWLAVVTAVSLLVNPTFAQQSPPDVSKAPQITPPPTPTLLPDITLAPLDAEVNKITGIEKVRQNYNVSGKGLVVAIIDSGINRYHKDFGGVGKLVAEVDFTDDQPSDALDYDGHGSNVASIIAARLPDGGGINSGVAPNAGIAALKVQSGVEDQKVIQWEWVSKALDWVIAHHADHADRPISVVNLSLGTTNDPWANVKTDGGPLPRELARVQSQFRELRKLKVAVVISAGNSYFPKSEEGMAFPAICRETISVGAIYSSNTAGNKTHPLKAYKGGATAYRAVAGRCTPFTQRLSEAVGGLCKTKIFTSGFRVSGAGPVCLKSDAGVDELLSSRSPSMLDGTSQSAPVVAGMILLLQEHYLKLNHQLPSIDEIEAALWDGGAVLKDPEDAVAKIMDNVTSCGGVFRSMNPNGAFLSIDKPKAGIAPANLSPISTDPARLAALFELKVSTAEKLKAGLPKFPDFKPRVWFRAADQEQKTKQSALFERIFYASKIRFRPVAITENLNSNKPDMVEVRFLRYPEDQPVAQAMLDLLEKEFDITNARISFTLRSPRAEQPGDIEVYFPREIKIAPKE